MTIFVALVGFAALGGLAGCAIAYRRWRQEAREVARIRGMFSRYVAPAVVDVLLARKDERLFTGRAVRATVLVCRIRNFSHFIEDLSPEETLRYLNEFYGLAGTAIQRHRGIIDAFLGDGIVAVFGVPLDNPMQEDDAVGAALAIVRHVVAMRERWARQNRKAFTVGIGVNSGEVIAGDAGFRDRREFTVVGPEATFAHRLQEAAFALNAFIVASRSTCEPLADEYSLVPVSGVPLPGVRRLLDAFVVRGRKGGAERFTVPVDALIETTIESDQTGTQAAAAATGALVPATPAAAAAHSPPQQQQPSPKAAAGPEQEPPIARPRRSATATADLGLPELRHGWMFPDREAEAIFPDPPPPRATYEDRSGPPLDL
jgi:class 3 adenylate cyclase